MDHPPLDHDPRIRAWADSASRCLLLLDYDGTLTPIAMRPDQARLAPEARRVLGALARHPRFVTAVQSGRRLEDLEGMVNIDGLILAGNHGLEIRGPGVRFTEPAADGAAPTLRRLTDGLEVRLRSIPGAWVENKRLTASVHVRETPAGRWVDVARVVADGLESYLSTFRMTTGHAVFEIRPRHAWDKGSASRWIKERCAADVGMIVVMGDDDTDEDAFRALPDAVSVKVGGDGPTSARRRLASPAEVAAFLTRLLAAADRAGDGRAAIIGRARA